MRGPPYPPPEPHRDRWNHKGTTVRQRHVTGVTRVVGVDSEPSAPAPSVRARHDRESSRALLYGRGSVTQIVAPTVVVGD